MTAWHRPALRDGPGTFVSYNNLLEICLFSCSLVIPVCQPGSRHWVLTPGPGTRAEFGSLRAKERNKDGGKPSLRYSVAAGVRALSRQF